MRALTMFVTTVVVLTSAAVWAVPARAQSTITLLGTVRDFNDTHPDFESYVGDDRGIVLPTLDAERKPVYAGQEGNPSTHGQEAFDQWSHDAPGVNLAAPLEITLTQVGMSNVYDYSNSAFFPIDDQLLGNQGRSHNYHFTYEIHATFAYNGGETFAFTGDDDLFIFMNHQLVIDLGGVHGAETASVALDEIAGTIGITPGHTYDLDLFFAERHTTESSFHIQTSLFLMTPVTPATWGAIKSLWR
jgi:fibro-slime domain-containing protein